MRLKSMNIKSFLSSHERMLRGRWRFGAWRWSSWFQSVSERLFGRLFQRVVHFRKQQFRFVFSFLKLKHHSAYQKYHNFTDLYKFCTQLIVLILNHPRVLHNCFVFAFQPTCFVFIFHFHCPLKSCLNPVERIYGLKLRIPAFFY